MQIYSEVSRGQRGSILVLVMTLLAALLSVGATVLYLQLAATRSTSLVASSRSGLYCAEAGLSASRTRIGESFALWQDMLDADPANDPTWYPIQGDIDGDGTFDYRVTIRDDDDELPPLTNDPTKDNNLKVYVISECITNPQSPARVLELVTYQGAGNVYRNQSGGGSGNTGNQN